MKLKQEVLDAAAGVICLLAGMIMLLAVIKINSDYAELDTMPAPEASAADNHKILQSIDDKVSELVQKTLEEGIQ